MFSLSLSKFLNYLSFMLNKNDIVWYAPSVYLEWKINAKLRKYSLNVEHFQVFKNLSIINICQKCFRYKMKITFPLLSVSLQLCIYKNTNYFWIQKLMTHKVKYICRIFELQIFFFFFLGMINKRNCTIDPFCTPVENL